jgi:hypothetical protein
MLEHDVLSGNEDDVKRHIIDWDQFVNTRLAGVHKGILLHLNMIYT